ncbi:MAG TPA: glucosamine-6-phosphate deaminase [Anaerohalosphaeraceae bacterium]|jgi:glucosamine-6-phosphate deaminase|nr:glucosamine-6-phosphate deaminase [Anaerohalosphaeraceae bacterium]HRT49049.1 glucosamine-6-phosphate deaminase [Anaerohalosphaeraceae bacterium]HRT85698.1 glucosamine-6-phosphate deaminase [Anaerohalosphaeraceae bacterium]
MERFVFGTKEQMGAAAAEKGADEIRIAIAERGRANIILATGASQFEMLRHLVAARGIDWGKVVMFHLDEYIGLDAEHPASFRKYLRERFVEKVPALAAVHYVNGDADDPEAECERLGKLIRGCTIDVAMVGIGENGHLAFNDPPADFETEAPYIVVDLDEKCRRQQLGEGWFATLEDVPRQAISMSIRQIMKSRCIVVTVPDQRKAAAVAAALDGPISNMCPASILQKHPDCLVYMDKAAASLLR